jgi:hypothetical protein
MAVTKATRCFQSNPSVDIDDVDRDRIIGGHFVPDEYFCPICQSLLWQPRACATCQHLFCQKFIRTWLENSNCGNTCPFRCEPCQKRPCPPYMQSLLARLNIRYGNSSFGCTRVLKYELLERHENFQCKYLTQRCPKCMRRVYVVESSEHLAIPGGIMVPSNVLFAKLT